MPSPDPKSASKSPQPSQQRTPDPAGQSPEDPIEFTSNTDVARGNEERANAEPEPPALHDAEVPGVPDPRGQKADKDRKRD
jgi:hypothetical protein